MGIMKERSLSLESLGYNPCTITLADLERRPRGETEAGRMRRLAAKAIVEGCQVLYLLDDTGRFVVTSGSVEKSAYVVDTYAGTCSCGAGAAGHLCKHRLLVMLECGELLLPESEPVAA